MISSNSGISILTLVLIAILSFGVGCGGSQASADTPTDRSSEPSAQDDAEQTDQGEGPGATHDDGTPGAQLVEERCVGCHDLEIVYEENLTREQWLEEVNLMVSRGATLTEEERDVVVDFLASR